MTIIDLLLVQAIAFPISFGLIWLHHRYQMKKLGLR